VKTSAIGLQSIGSLFQAFRSGVAPGSIPCRPRPFGGGKRRDNFVRGGVARLADDIAGMCSCASEPRNACTSLGSPKSTPLELRRSEYSAAGSGKRACANDSNRSSSEMGSRTMSATGTCSSMKRLTKEVFAPFSSRRRTK
jgi:hypothetical protein